MFIMQKWINALAFCGEKGYIILCVFLIDEVVYNDE